MFNTIGSPCLAIDQLRSLFPILNQHVHGNPLVYFDNAATTHKPYGVIRSAQHFYEQDNANIHRGVHALSNRATIAVENTRAAVQKLIHAPEEDAIIFTSGTTESLNLIAATYGEMEIHEGDEILISEMEHHANLLPWQLLCKRKKAVLKALPIDNLGALDLTDLDQWINKRTKIVALTYVSNTLGVINPIASIIAAAHAHGAIVVIDGAQAVAHFPVDVTSLDCDFFAFSAHKVYGLTGLGFLYGKSKWLKHMIPYQTGGGMVKQVTLKEVVYEDLPYKFEAGTLPLAAIISFNEAIKLILDIGYPQLMAHEAALFQYAWTNLANIPAVQLIGSADHKVGIIAFNIIGMHHLDVGLLLDTKGIAVRTGHCCTQPLMERLGIDGVVRISFGLYNTIAEIDFFLKILRYIVHKSAITS